MFSCFQPTTRHLQRYSPPCRLFSNQRFCCPKRALPLSRCTVSITEGNPEQRTVLSEEEANSLIRGHVQGTVQWYWRESRKWEFRALGLQVTTLSLSALVTIVAPPPGVRKDRVAGAKIAHGTPLKAAVRFGQFARIEDMSGAPGFFSEGASLNVFLKLVQRFALGILLPSFCTKKAALVIRAGILHHHEPGRARPDGK